MPLPQQQETVHPHAAQHIATEVVQGAGEPEYLVLVKLVAPAYLILVELVMPNRCPHDLCLAGGGN